MYELVERDEEEKTLARIHGERAPGRRRLVAVSGPLASGKTALLRAFARGAAAKGATVLEAAASIFERRQPLGIMDQLLRGHRLLSQGAQREVHDLVEQIGRAERPAEISPRILGLLHGAFQPLADSAPLVICLDDAHFTDVESLQYLLALMRRMGNAPISIVLSYCPDMGCDSVQRLIQAEILRMPDHTCLDIEPLSVAGVATVLGEYFPPAVAARIAPQCHRLSGGRPLLVHALAEDNSAPGAQSPPAAGPVFGRAVLSCLYRAEPIVLAIAQATAMLGEGRPKAVVARLCGLDLESLGRVAASPGVGGLLDPDLLGQPSVRESILRGIPQTERRDMLTSAARLLHHEGVPALVTADYLMRVDEAIPWAGHVLVEAADQALAGGDHETALGYLEKAHRGCAGPRERTDTAAKIVDVMWRHNPAAAKAYLPDLVAAAEQGGLRARQAVPVVRSLLWNGQEVQAGRVIARLAGPDRPAPAEDDAARHVNQLRLWLPLTYPGIAAPRAAGPAGPDSGAGSADSEAANALGAVLRGTDDEATVPTAELVLRQALAAAAGPAATLASLMVLIYSDSLDKASVWCDALLASRGETYGPVWSALFTTVRAEIHYRLGDLASARQSAYTALALLPGERWGAAVVFPLSLLILTATAMGNLPEAAKYLDFFVPSAAFGTLGAVAYLDARGQFHLARGCPDGALQDFLAAGHLMKLWEADCPSAVPWRAHAAQAYLLKGLTTQAKALLTEHIALLPSGHLRTRGLAYRTLAATLPAEARPPVLLKAAGILDRCGDSLNLARTLADLGRAHESLGDVAQARSHAHQARTLADRCGATLPEPAAAAVGQLAGADGFGEGAPAANQLSTAEWRVAKLAANGSTNEQIARKLFITVSTVEQHLTRAYRKLGIRRRTQLASCLTESVR